jgi:hypothetical protein
MILSVLRKLLRLPKPKLFSTESAVVKRELILILSLLLMSEIEPPRQVVPQSRAITTKPIYILGHELRPLRLQ